MDSISETDPGAEDEPANETTAVDELPPGWESFVDDESGCVYYYNTLTYATQWEKPTSPACSNHNSGEFQTTDDHHATLDIMNDNSRQVNMVVTRAVPPSRKRIAIAEMEVIAFWTF